MRFIFDNDRPIYIQLVEQLRLSIVSGEVEVGSRLPSVRELALMAKVNPNTMQKALAELENEKLIYTERTNGKFITNDEKLLKKVRSNLANEKIDCFLSDMRKIGISDVDAIMYLQEIINK